MNRKGAKEQNDISRIIGNLPKRLQRKIAQETGAGAADYNIGEIPRAKNVQPDNVAVKEEIVSCQNAGGDQRSDVASIDMFLKMTTQSCVTARPIDDAPIPGILRIQKKDKSQQKLLERQQQQHQHHPLTLTTTKRETPANCNNNSKQHPSWFEFVFIKDLSYAKPLPLLHDFVTDLLKRKVVIENWDALNGFRKQLKDIFLQLLLNQMKFCCEQNVESYFWKLLYYNIIEYLKTHSDENQTTENELKSIDIINDGLQYYSMLLEHLSRKYLRTTNNGSSTSTNTNTSNDGSTHKYQFIAKVSSQKVLICLGDLYRYKSKILNSNDYTDACQFYQRAQSLIPSNGIPYNQLAILAIYSRKKLDAIYYHMRSLMSSNAIQSARESLKVLFDEIRKKYEENNKSPLFGTPERKFDKEPKSLRKEVWVYPDGVRRLHKTDLINKSIESEEKRLTDLPGEEVLKRFTSTYLYIIGKLFSGIGFENFQENVKKIMVQLKVILNCPSSLIITRHRLLKIAALNIFVITHNKSNDSRKEIFNHAFNVSNQVFGIIVKFANKRLLESKDRIVNSNSADGLDVKDLNTLLQYIKVWCDWLSVNTDLWKPFHNTRQQELNPWLELEQHIHILQQIHRPESNDTKSIHLEEDIFLNGFVSLPLNDYQICDSYTSANETDQFFVRINKIYAFGKIFFQYISNMENVALVTDIKHKTGHIDLDTFEEYEEGDENDNSENIIPIDSLSKLDVCDKDMEDILQLSKLKKELEAKTNITKKYNEKLEEILKFVDTKLYIEVRPKYLLPDTNCFIDYLDDFEALIKNFKKYILVVPLTVVKELDGLSKGVKIETHENSQVKKNRIHHFDDVSTRAKKSLEFIKSANNNVKCATTKGSIINASLFALVEEQQASNDDKILATALALTKSMSKEANKDGKTFIQTELVLITTDRNLRVKALARKLAVSELKEFLQWANDSID
ncbi:telomerase-binding protein EST1A [Eupeodes corollae]|uniref:telomerase-binding protein EST1A n=1 Tax=Eupeodes corollae TaxID=290404 RepID=UPI0024929F35|nr:telomerase-binding protein EST1A [Eupeodes corollae]